MSDYGEKFTDKKIEEINKRIQYVYREAEKDIQKKMDDFTKEFKKDEEKYLKLLKEGKVSQDNFDAWHQKQVFRGKIWQSKKDQISEVLHNSNDVSIKIINGETNRVFFENANYAAYALEHGAGVNFGFELYDNATVSRLIRDDPKLLPEWKIHEKKDYIWNQKKLNNCITQGIIQGESLDKITRRVAEGLSGQNHRLMQTFATTAMAGAQNAGRDTRYKEAEKLGINLVEEWIATLDRRTRDSHRQMDGEKKKPGKTFSNGCRFPGDPFAPAHEVYNCRCALSADLVDYPDEEYERYDNESRKSIKAMSYREWEQYKAKVEAPKHHIVNGKDISSTWIRRTDEFDFEIEDVMNAQGFDGLPRVVSPEEFDELVKQANNGNGFIAQRTYSAPDKETLDAYRDQLYNGKWYVDCSTGGAQYGQGMYCAADYNGKLTDGIKQEMEHYKELAEGRYPHSVEEARQKYINDEINKAGSELERVVLKEKIYGNTTSEEWDLYSTRTREQEKLWSKKAEKIEESARNIHGFDYTETLTLDPSAKIITYDDIFQMKVSYPNKVMEKYKLQYLEENIDILGEGGIEFAKRNANIGGYEFDWKRMNELYNDMSDEAKDIANKALQIMPSDEEMFKYNQMDLGSFAAMLGYDAIDAVGHGASSSYTVVLNRTKLIIRSPK